MAEPFIHEALDSLLSQTFTDFELIISDNASTDRTEEFAWSTQQKISEYAMCGSLKTRASLKISSLSCLPAEVNSSCGALWTIYS